MFIDSNMFELEVYKISPASGLQDSEPSTVRKSTARHRAQVAVESRSEKVKNTSKTSRAEVEKEEDRKKNNFDISILKPKLSASLLGVKADIDVRGLVALVDKIVVVDHNKKELLLFDSSGRFLSSTSLKEDTWGITRVNNDRFATSGHGNKVFLWRLIGQNIVHDDVDYDVDHPGYGIHYNNTYYCVLHQPHSAITVLDGHGKQVRKITMQKAFGKKITLGWDIHMDSDTHNIYVPCVSTNSGVLCLSVDGEALWFTPLPDAGLRGITEIHGVLCIADIWNQCIYQVSNTGWYLEKLMKMVGKPKFVFYNECDMKLYVSQQYNMSVYTIEFVWYEGESKPKCLVV